MHLPVSKRSTWAFNYFRSDTHVMNRGQTDTAELGRDCAAIADPAASTECRRYLDSIAAQNAHGTATSLGGFRRLRSYPENRYKGAHAEFLGTEQMEPDRRGPAVNIYIMGHLFICVLLRGGRVADTAGVWDIVRRLRRGRRMVTTSGLVYLDFATGI